jgi:hypothetical protein
MRSALQIILDELERLGLPGRALMKPGLSKEQYGEMMQRLDVTPPPGHFELYATCNGVNEEVYSFEPALFPDFVLPSLERAVASFHGLAKGLQGAPARHWRPHWFPVFWDMAGSYYLLAMNASKPDFQEVYFLTPAFETRRVFARLEFMLNAIAECYREGAFRVEDGELVSNWADQQEIFRKNSGF